MLVTQPESIQRQASGSRIGLAIAGGGPVGLVYEIGALRALDEALEGIDFNQLDVYVGVSAGAVTASLLANQIKTEQICHIFISNESREHPLDPQIFLTPAFGEYWRRLASVPRLLWESCWRYLQNPFDLSLLLCHLLLQEFELFENLGVEVIRKRHGQQGRKHHQEQFLHLSLLSFSHPT